MTTLEHMDRVEVALDDRPYAIYIKAGAIEILPQVLSAHAVRGTVALVTDSNVAPLYAEMVADLLRAGGTRVHLCVMPAGEANKRLAQIEFLCGEFLKAGLDRSSVVLALGGGVVGDVAGYAAATFMRGIRHVQIPTTIVAQVDSSVGGKTAVNHPLAKNIIGAFHQPSAVIVDLNFLSSLPDRELRAGIAEVIKHGIIADAELFAYMERHVSAILERNLAKISLPVWRSCEIKGAIVGADEREQGIRANLNYGHTFGHAIEAVSGYERFLHGEAIALGMHAAGILARDLGMVDDEFVERQRKCIEAYGLPVHWSDLPVDQTIEAMRHDKKARTGTLMFVLAEQIGRVVRRTDVEVERVRKALQALT